ncbi:MAG: hydroxymethylbilane synthase [Pseudomonadota bacterium]
MIRIGTRSSPLALIQATLVRDALAFVHPNKRIEIIPFSTRGDRTTKSLHDIGGKALFTKELQDALLEGTIDAAVHSLKDVELHDLPLILGAHLPRVAAHDVLITRKACVVNLASDGLLFDSLSQKAVLGTCSPRRAAQATRAWPDVRIVDLRGNVGTRLQHVADSNIDATILAAAGLARLGLVGDAFASAYPTLQQTDLSIETFVPAAGQGIIAVESRPNDAHLFAGINDSKTEQCAVLERKFSAYLGGSCRTALGAHVRFFGVGSSDVAHAKSIEILAFFEGRTQRCVFCDHVSLRENSTQMLFEAIAHMAEMLKG